jgi:peptide deformylase
MAILPIVTYNDPILNKEAEPVSSPDEELHQLIEDMFETMYNANGVGLAAPQIGRLIRLFVVDADIMAEETDEVKHGPLVFINPEIAETKGEIVRMEEGCLSIPEVRDEVKRPDSVTVRFLDRNFTERKAEYSGWLSRVVQHEYDHLQGTLFLDHLSAFRRRLHKSALQKIDSGLIETDYPLVSKVLSKSS